MPPLLRWLLRLGPSNPVAVRIVAGGSRRARHMYIRTGYLAALIATLLWSLLLGAGAGALSYRDLAAAGARSFQYVAYLQIALICVLAPVFMSGAIRQESNPRTWDILLTTPLTPLQIVLGNLVGRLFFVGALLISALPLFAITQYFGGVPGRSIFAATGVALAASLIVGAVAVALAASPFAGRRAFFAFYVAVVSYLALTWAGDAALRQTSGGVTWLTPVNPFLALESLLNPTGYARPAPEALGAMQPLTRFWLGSPVLAWGALSVTVSALLAAWAALAVRLRATGEGKSFFRAVFPGGEGAGAERHRGSRTVWHNPIAWGEAAARGMTPLRRAARWTFLALGGLWALALIATFHGGMTAQNFRFGLLATVSTELAVIALVAINIAATAVSREREDGSLDLLLTTPVTASMYLGGKLRGLISFLLPLLAVPLGTLALAGAYVGVGGFGRVGGVTISELARAQRIDVPVVLPEVGVFAPLIVVPFMAFLVMVGLWWSVRSKGTIASVVGAVVVVGAVAGTLGLCGWGIGSQTQYVGPALAGSSPAPFLYAAVHPARALEATVAGSDGLSTARVALAIGALLGGIAHAAVVAAMRSSLTRRFDMTVRQLAGTK